ncbi:MAG: acetyl-CoA carboxylase carboxyltransferase subunit alpha [Clostridia bacterium]|nr:acetyl-CoA carboxylase carboxyltransferase subunit alpha [Clostridia bacterium]
MSKPSAWDVVQTARDLERPTSQYFIDHIFTDFTEMHGDKLYGDDAAIVGGVGWLGDMPVTVIGQEKGVTLSEKARCNFGSAHPEGYRKSLRLMKQAEKFGRPVVCIVDTQGAFCGVGAEERGMGEAIARNMLELSRLKTPVVSVLIGEGGSGGAIALAVSDRLAMLENSIYTILSPEGFSSILWKEAARAPEAAELMRVTAAEVYDMGLVDDVIPEPEGGAKQNDDGAFAQQVRSYLEEQLAMLTKEPVASLLEKRYQKFRGFGKEYIVRLPQEKRKQASSSLQTLKKRPLTTEK